MEHRTQCNGYGIPAAHDQNTETSSHEERGGGGIQCTVSYRNWLTDSLLSDTHNSVKFGKHSRFSSIVICWPIRVRLCRLGKFSMPIIFGKPEKNISKDLTFFPDPFCNFSNLTPFTVHYRQKKWAVVITGHWDTKRFLTYVMSRLCSGKNWLGSQQYPKIMKSRVPSIMISMKKLRLLFFSSPLGESGTRGNWAVLEQSLKCT